VLSSWIRSLRHWATNKSEQDSRASCTDPRIGRMIARMQEAEEKAWWREKTSAVGGTDQQLLVIGPRADADSAALAALGASLREWQATRSYARHIWGLNDLLEGRPPRTPPIYLSVPYPCERYEEQFEQVALVFVAAGTDMRGAAEDLAVASKLIPRCWPTWKTPIPTATGNADSRGGHCSIPRRSGQCGE
jgi:hypothetical protein